MYFPLRFLRHRSQIICVLILAMYVYCSSAEADSENSSPSQVVIKSMGMPPQWKPYFGPMAAWGKGITDADVLGELHLGVYRDLMNPVFAVFGLAGEGYVRGGGEKVDGGIRVLGVSRLFFLRGGIDYSFQREELDAIMSLQIPLRRSGPLGQGGNLRFDWLPGRGPTFGLGLSIPLGQPYMGKTRPRSDRVTLPTATEPREPIFEPDSILQGVLDNIKHAAEWINRFKIPFLDQETDNAASDIRALKETMDDFKDHIHKTDQFYPNGHSLESEVASYHAGVERAFSAVVGESSGSPNALGVALADKAREVLLSDVIIPYNQLIGQRKKHDSVFGFGSRAAANFGAWVRDQSGVTLQYYSGILYVFRSLIEFIDDSREQTKEVWGDSRLNWIPMNYALQFEDHDTEEELDAIIEKLIGQEFTDANDVHYVVNEMFQTELVRTIQSTENYHVLWIHDFRGTNTGGEPDRVAYELVVDTYLRALTEHVRTYDETGNIPVFMIFLDQHYFEINKGRVWMELLEDPLGHTVNLPSEYRGWEDTIRVVQQELRETVEKSAGLQSGMDQFGKDWLKNQVKVHVNITNPSDPSFRTEVFFRYLPFIPDNLMRDHRKVAFYDVTELDPGKGEAIFTGMGVGEHYVGPTWDDRSILARGPVLVSLKSAARELLLSQGLDVAEIPVPLQPIKKPENYDELLDQLRAQGWTASAMQVHNTTGFGRKSANIIKAVLYDLMPKGSHLYIPDSLWNSPFWGGMLVGAALRGCTVLVVSPAEKNAPSFGSPQMSRANELFTRFVIIQNYMHDEIASAGGLFKVGIYNMELDVGDVAGKLQSLIDGIGHSEVFHRVFPFSQSVLEMIKTMPEYLKSQGIEPTYIAEDVVTRRPKLHMKAQFFASESTINTVIPLEGWEPLIRNYIIARARQSAHTETKVEAEDLRSSLAEKVAHLLTSWESIMSPNEKPKAIVYLTVGSHNQDYRSMMMDGEVLFVTARMYAMIAYLDFVSLMGQTTWIDDIQQLEELLPKQGGFWKQLGRYMKVAL